MARKPGRNEPCPCGSGRKYKKCCGARRQRASFTQPERDSAHRKLAAMPDGPGWGAVEEQAAEEFWGPFIDLREGEPDEVRRMMSQSSFEFWLFFDYRLDDGRRLVDAFLETGPPLSAGERAYLEAVRSTAMRLYEVVEVQPGASIALREVPSGAEVRVRERTGSRTLHRWDLIAARVMPVGASGEPEMEGGVFPLPRLMRERMLASIEQELSRARKVGVDEFLIYEQLPPMFHQAWLQPLPLPELVTFDGDPVLLTRVLFDVVDRDLLIAALDASSQLERDSGDDAPVWHWSGKGRQRAQPEALGRLVLHQGRLELETHSAERGERGRSLIERWAASAVRYRTTVSEHPHRALEDARIEDAPAAEPLPEDLREPARQIVEQELQQYYETWLDEPVPALDDRAPREAARSERLRPRLVELLKDLEHMYERQLSDGKPTFDPTWMWDELGIDELRDAPRWRQHPPILGHEAMDRHLPGFRDLARQIADRTRARRADEDVGTISRDDLAADLGFSRFVRDQFTEARSEGADAASAAFAGELAASWLELRCNFELHRRKVFWVDDALAWMLGATEPDVTGEMLRLPFASFALVFSDRFSLGLAERMLSSQQDARLRGRLLQILTVYVTEISGSDGARGLRVALSCDALDGEWPYLLERDLAIQPDARLDAMLDSHFPEVDVDDLEPIFESAALRGLLGLIINAILYATSAEAQPERRQPPEPPEPAGAGERRTFSSEKVYYLPGKIDIRTLRNVQLLRRRSSDGPLTSRSLVRGHWRRANRRWKDQRPRWIRPYWRGPSTAAIVEREYRLKP